MRSLASPLSPTLALETNLGTGQSMVMAERPQIDRASFCGRLMLGADDIAQNMALRAQNFSNVAKGALAAVGVIAAFGGPAVATAEANPGREGLGSTPNAVAAANRRCADKATDRPHHMKWGLAPGKKSTYRATFSVDALNASCNGLGKRMGVYRMEFRRRPKVNKTDYFLESGPFPIGGNKAKKYSTDMVINPKWCDKKDPENSPPFRLRVTTGWRSKSGAELSDSHTYFTPARKLC